MMIIRGLSPVLCALVCVAVLGCERQTAKSGNLSASAERNPPAAPPAPVVGVAMEDFSACHPQGSALAGCLTTRGVLPAGWAQADFDQCLTASNPTALDAASCLSSRGLTIFHYRAPFQTDFETCGVRAGNASIAGCLNRNGLLPTTLTQAQIDGCVATNGGVMGIEKCLRARGFLTKKAALFQADLNLCDKVDGTGRIATCLFNNDLVAATVTQANVDTCITNVGIGSVVRCLRNNRLVNNALMQAHIGLCTAAVGQAGVAACLDAQGLLEGGVQADIDSCVTAVGIGSVVRCFRTRGLIPNVLLQAHANSCDQAVGSASLFACLTANGLLLNSPGVNLAETNDCVTRLGVGATVRCLVTKRLVTDFTAQAHINGCNRYGGQANIATCLGASGVLLPGLTQTQFDTCITNVGLANVETCLRNNGFIQTFSSLIAAGGVFNVRCMTCHNAVQMRGMMNVLVHASVLAKVVAGNPAVSVMDQRINNAAMPMPPTGLLVQAERDRIRTWILQGARNN